MRRLKEYQNADCFFTRALFYFIVIVISGCTTAPPPSGQSGSIAVNIKLVEGNESDSGIQHQTLDFSRAPSGDYKVYVRVFDLKQTLLAQGGPWNWNQGQGTVSNVPPGPERTITADVYDAFGGTLLYSGSLYNRTINAGPNNFTGSPIYVFPISDGNPSSCSNFSGTWRVDGTDYSECTGEYSDFYTYTFYINQTGCDAELTVEGWLDPINGYVMGDTLYLDDTTLFFSDGMMIYTNWELTVVDAETFDGDLDWQATYSSGNLCSGSSYLDGVRIYDADSGSTYPNIQILGLYQNLK